MIKVDHLTKSFVRYTKMGRVRRSRTLVTAVDEISMSIQAGEMVGYIGANGAGKSTTIKMLTGILAPTSGTVSVAGLTPLDDRVALARKIGVVFGQRSQLWWDLPLRDSFDLLRHIYRVSAADHLSTRTGLIDTFDVGSFLDTPVRQLSLGQRMRGELVASLLHRPSVLFLDEPTIGLDVVSKYAVREALAALNRDDGVTVVLTTHDLTDIEQLCQRVIIIDGGKLVADEALATLKSRQGGQRTMIVDLDRAMPALVIEGVDCTGIDGPRQWLSFSPPLTAADVLAAVSAAADVRDLTMVEPDIESIVRDIYNTHPA